MQRIQRLTVVLAMVFSIGIPALAPIAVYALDDTSTSTDTTEMSTPEKRAAKRAAMKTKLEAKKLEICKKRETAINASLTRIVTRGERQLDVFDKISTRVQEFYATKGKTVTNYDVLLKAVTDAKAKATTDLDGLKDEEAEFKCDGTDPKGQASLFKEALKTEIADLKAYKTSIKNLIVAVKSAQGDAKKDTDTKTESETENETETTTPTGGQ